MSGKILTTKNCTFKCTNLSGTVKLIETQVAGKHNSGNILTERMKFACIGTCTVLQGAPCPNTVNTASWMPGSFESNVRIQGAKMLNSNARKICPNGGLITVNVSSSAISSGILVPSVTVPPGMSVSSGISADNVGQTKDVHKESPQGHQMTDDETLEKSNNEEKDSKEEQLSENAVKSARCDAENCPQKDVCEYLKSVSSLTKEEGIYIGPDGKTQNSAASILRKNAIDSYKEYEKKDNEEQNRTRMKWSNQAHHLISIKAAFGKYPELVRLAHFYGYDINCKENCIFLPSHKREEGFGKMGEVYKRINAANVMDVTRRQWHVGGHEYGISDHVFSKLPESKKQELTSYNELVNRKTKKILNDFQQIIESKGMFCYYDDQDTMCKSDNAARFIAMMNGLSEEIRTHLDAFSIPEDSFPYYVSKQALEYAFMLPRSGKVICAIYNDNQGRKGWKLIRYQYERYKKDGYEVKLIENENASMIIDYYMKEKTEELIEFFSNTRHFFVFDNYDRVSLPFSGYCNTYYIHREVDSYSIYTSDNVLIRRLEADIVPRSRNIISELGPVVAVVLRGDDDEKEDLTIARIVKRRKRECGLL